MKAIKLTNNQFLAVVNIIRTQTVPLAEIRAYLGVLNCIDGVIQDQDGSFTLNLEENDLNVLVSIVENGNILVKDIPFAISLLNVLSPPRVVEPEVLDA